ncbi:DUF5316 family protein [Alicyclobacillus fastidiosus]|uniref:DUF5316 family protein n=1 Tax=Alicyclobacillus fastidiosus TaxID=392011 RepID=A0ABV5AM60_9BACL|nr:DUF5316 family protein [Alicyclobacillus fastidiosus]WEH08472.1 DUF5316 family protein [Alicyclobacillus fastidiosus]
MKTLLYGLLSGFVLMGILFGIGAIAHNFHFTQIYMIRIGVFLVLFAALIVGGLSKSRTFNLRFSNSSDRTDTGANLNLAGLIFLTGLPNLIIGLFLFYASH